MTEAPLVESIDSSTGGGRHIPRVCTIEDREYVHILKLILVCRLMEERQMLRSTAFMQVRVISILLHISVSLPPAMSNARSKIDKRVDNLNIMTKYRHLRWLAYVFIENLYFGFGPVDLQTKL